MYKCYETWPLTIAWVTVQELYATNAFGQPSSILKASVDVGQDQSHSH
jgi:hypothetical protein